VRNEGRAIKGRSAGPDDHADHSRAAGYRPQSSEQSCAQAGGAATGISGRASAERHRSKTLKTAQNRKLRSVNYNCGGVALRLLTNSLFIAPDHTYLSVQIIEKVVLSPSVPSSRSLCSVYARGPSNVRNCIARETVSSEGPHGALHIGNRRN
jgi:hypothetical protein